MRAKAWRTLAEPGTESKLAIESASSIPTVGSMSDVGGAILNWGLGLDAWGGSVWVRTKVSVWEMVR